MIHRKLFITLLFSFIFYPQLSFASSFDFFLQIFCLKQGQPVKKLLFPVFNGVEQSNESIGFLRPFIEEGSVVFLMGSGKSGDVYRVVPPSGKSFVLKKYSRNTSMLEKDVKRLDVLRGLKEKYWYFPFKVIDYEVLAEDTLRVSEVSGQTVYSIVYNKEIAKNFNLFIDKKYSFAMESFYKILNDAFSSVSIKGGSYELTLEDGGVIEIYLHRKNILVDPQTLDLTIIDPY